MEKFKTYLQSRRIANEKNHAFCLHWVTQFFGFCGKHPEDDVGQAEVERYLGYLSKRKEDWQVRQASDAIQVYLFFKKRNQAGSGAKNRNTNDAWVGIAEEMSGL